MTTAQSPHIATFKACSADCVRAEFGVCRGEPIQHFQDLMLGDIYRSKRDAKWVAVSVSDTDTSGFTLDLAANLPTRKLTNLAHLIFMTTSGRRTDVFATICDGLLHFVSETEFQVGVEYVLIDIQMRDEEFVPAVVPTPQPSHAPKSYAREPISTLRLIG